MLSRSPRIMTLLGIGLITPLLLALPAHADDELPEPPGDQASVTVSGESSAFMRTRARLLVTITGPDLDGASVALHAKHGNEPWKPVETTVADAAGAHTFDVDVRGAQNRYRAVLSLQDQAPLTSEVWQVRGRRHVTKTTLKGPRTVVDESRITLRSTSVSNTTGAFLKGARVVLQRRANKKWKRVKVASANKSGRASFTVNPRQKTRFRAVTKKGAWFKRSSSKRHIVKNVPQVAPVKLPAAAPQPRIKLPKQKRATRRGAHAVVSRIPNHVWRSMQGKSWRKGCIPRSRLRLLRVNYWGFDGYRYRGEMVVAASTAGRIAAAFTSIYKAKLRLRSMYRVDRFGYSRVLRGADDYKSMAAGNTSAFNCRNVVGRPGVRSPHASGRAVDVNPWENPYRTSHGWTPNRWWVGRSHPQVAWSSGNHRMVKIMRSHGLRWTYGNADAHHFDS